MLPMKKPMVDSRSHAAFESGFVENWLDQNKPALKVALPSTIGPIRQTASFFSCLSRLAPLFSFFFHSVCPKERNSVQ
jgi:hypothetical protein